MNQSIGRPISSSWAGLLLGFALGGFFDGILLHQILQWHHLLSLVEGVGDIRSQLFFDGIFHAMMYIIAVIGLVLLWTSRGTSAATRANTTLFGTALIGFGSWHIMDAVLSHWILGIHRIKIDSPNPMIWDLAWLVAFGLVPLVIGIWLKTQSSAAAHGSYRHRLFGIIFSAIILGAGVVAATPSPAKDNASTSIAFHPLVSDGHAFDAIRAQGGGIIGRTRGVWVVKWQEDKPPDPLYFYANGAILLGRAGLGSGCSGWTKV